MSDSVRCEYSVEGHGPPLFLIHGIGAARDVWRFVTPHLTEQFTVISYDLRGHGKSRIPDHDFGLEELVEDLSQLQALTGIRSGPLRWAFPGRDDRAGVCQKIPRTRIVRCPAVDGSGSHQRG